MKVTVSGVFWLDTHVKAWQNGFALRQARVSCFAGAWPLNP
jgi:hypothetical protein